MPRRHRGHGDEERLAGASAADRPRAARGTKGRRAGLPAMATLTEARDAAVAADVREVLAGHRHLGGLALELAVRGGVAHVRGRTRSRAERELTRRTVARVRGVNAVWDLL